MLLSGSQGANRHTRKNGHSSGSRRPASEIDLSQATPEEIFNASVAQFEQRAYHDAREGFMYVYEQGAYCMQAVYAALLCDRALGQPAQLPDGLKGRGEEVAVTFLASNLVCYLIQHRFRAYLSEQGPTAELWLQEPRSAQQYRVEVIADTVLGGFRITAYRIEGERWTRIYPPVRDVEPNAADLLIKEILDQAATLRLMRLPLAGLPLTAYC